eukprot:TRINITY_DN15787_c0_g1_i1.p1 TRINITY_DN15787_c0_g1~~TRINITY_DN15787_c0_g1_i1.p1  ORF type:complete len:561 (+),score=96.65 TRINITY_DN15787_c0_g1_i1:2-1684(+)
MASGGSISSSMSPSASPFFSPTDNHTDLDSWLIRPEFLELGEEIGRGSFGAVMKARYSGTDVAVKKVLESSEGVESLAHEASILQKLRHPNIVLFMGIARSNETYYIVQEFAKGGSLYKLVSNPKNKIPPLTQVKFVLEISQALSYIHTKNLLHRDLKMENVLLDSNSYGSTSVSDLRCKIADFGLSILYDPSKKERLESVGTLWWRAPEVDSFDSYDERADIFSFGMVVMEIITRASGEDIRLAIVYQKKGFLQFGVNSDRLKEEFGAPAYYISPALLNLSVECCREDPMGRPTMAQIIAKVSKLQTSLSSIVDEASTIFPNGPQYAEIWISLVYEIIDFDFNPKTCWINAGRIMDVISTYTKEKFEYTLNSKELTVLSTMLLNYQETFDEEPPVDQPLVQLRGFALFCDWLGSCLHIIEFIRPFLKAQFVEGFVLKEEATDALQNEEREATFICRFSTSTQSSLVVTCYLNSTIENVLLRVDQLGFFIDEKFYPNLKECFENHPLLSKMRFVHPSRPLESYAHLLSTPSTTKKIFYPHQGSIIANKKRAGGRRPRKAE